MDEDKNFTHNASQGNPNIQERIWVVQDEIKSHAWMGCVITASQLPSRFLVPCLQQQQGRPSSPTLVTAWCLLMAASNCSVTSFPPAFSSLLSRQGFGLLPSVGTLLMALLLYF